MVVPELTDAKGFSLKSVGNTSCDTPFITSHSKISQYKIVDVSKSRIKYSLIWEPGVFLIGLPQG